MIDSVLKGTGNSRFLKSAVPAGTSWADALAMLQAGTFPIDFNGINTEGFQQVGTPLNKANLLKDATAAQIGLPPSTTPDGMFQALGNTGELHVWRKTVKNAADVPAGYTMGAAQEVELIKGKNNSGSAIAYRTITVSYSASVTVSDDGKTITLVSPSTATIRSDYPAEADAIKGKFFKITQYQSTYVDVPSGVNFVPSSATFAKVYPNSNGWTSLTCSAMQTVTGYAKIPAGTTTTYPVSTNPKAYQEGDDAKAAGYVVGEVVNGHFRMSGTAPRNAYIYKYASSIAVDENGVVSLQNPLDLNFNSESYQGYESTVLSLISGKFLYYYRRDSMADSSDAPDTQHPFNVTPSAIVYIPADATITYSDTYPSGFYLDKYQPVTGYAAIPAGTTIEYLGKLGDKARVQVVSYVGTGTYGESNPNSLTFNFAPKIVKFLFQVEVGIGNHSKIENFQQDGEQYYMVSDRLTTEFAQGEGFGYNSYAVRGKKSADGKTFAWYTDIGSQAQGNQKGMKYYFVAIG